MTVVAVWGLLTLPGVAVVSAWSLTAPVASSRTWPWRRAAWTLPRRPTVSRRHRHQWSAVGELSGEPSGEPCNPSDNEMLLVESIDETILDVDDLWSATFDSGYFAHSGYNDVNGYRSRLLASSDQWNTFWESLLQQAAKTESTLLASPSSTSRSKSHSMQQQIDPFWEQIKLEAEMALRLEPQAGPQLYQTILSQPTLLSAICTVVSHEIETELIPATTLKNLFMDLLLHAREDNDPLDTVNRKGAMTSSLPSLTHYTPSYEEYCIRQDLQAVARRDPSVRHAMDAVLFHNGFHALVCYRVSHCLWQARRTALAYYMQSAVSRIYSADIHPACTMGSGLYLSVGAGVVIGETAVVDDDVTILEGVTLGGTGKEAGDRHPKVGSAVIIQDGAAVLGNIRVGDGAVVTAKSIVTKAVPPLAIVSGVPAKVVSARNVHLPESEWDDLDRSLFPKYQSQWRILSELQSTVEQGKDP